MKEGPDVLMATHLWEAAAAGVSCWKREAERLVSCAAVRGSSLQPDIRVGCCRTAEPERAPIRAPRHKWKRQAAVPRQPSKGRATAREVVDHYAVGKPTFGAAAGYGPNQAPPLRKTPRSGRGASARHQQPQSQPRSALMHPATTSDQFTQPAELYAQPPPPASAFEATVQAGMADLESIRQQMAMLEQPLDALRSEPDPEPELESAAPPGVYAAVRLNHMADLQNSPQHQRQQLEETGSLPPIGRTPRRQHSNNMPVSSPRIAGFTGSSLNSVVSSFNSPDRGRSGRQTTTRWRPEEELRLAEGVGFSKTTVGPIDWETVAAHVSAENLRGQRSRGAEECCQKWEAIQHGAALHELKLAVRMADAKRLQESLANAESVGFAGPEVEQAQAVLVRLQSAQKALSQMREASSAVRRQKYEDAGGEEAEQQDSECSLLELRNVIRRATGAAPLTLSAARKILRDHNHDRSGWIAYAEFRAALRDIDRDLDLADNDLRRVFRAVGKTDDGRVDLKRLAKSIWSSSLAVKTDDVETASPSRVAGGAGSPETNDRSNLQAHDSAAQHVHPDGQLVRELSLNADLASLMQYLGLEQYTEKLMSQGFEDVYTVSLASAADLHSIGFLMGHAVKLLQACEQFLAHGGPSPDSADGDLLLDAPLTGATAQAHEGSAATQVSNDVRSLHRRNEDLRRTANGTASAFARFTAKIDSTGAQTGLTLARAEGEFFPQPLSQLAGAQPSESDRTKAARAAAQYMAGLMCRHFHVWRRVSARGAYVQSVLVQRMVLNYKAALARAMARWGAYVVGLLAGEIRREDSPPLATDGKAHRPAAVAAKEEASEPEPEPEHAFTGPEPDSVDLPNAEAVYKSMAMMAPERGATHEAHEGQYRATDEMLPRLEASALAEQAAADAEIEDSNAEMQRLKVEEQAKAGIRPEAGQELPANERNPGTEPFGEELRTKTVGESQAASEPAAESPAHGQVMEGRSRSTARLAPSGTPVEVYRYVRGADDLTDELAEAETALSAGVLAPPAPAVDTEPEDQAPVLQARAIAAFAYPPEGQEAEPGDLSFGEGASVCIIAGLEQPSGWWTGFIEGDPTAKIGTFPSNYVQPLARCVYEYLPVQQGDLAMALGDVILVEDASSAWWVGTNTGNLEAGRGSFPSNYVEYLV